MSCGPISRSSIHHSELLKVGVIDVIDHAGDEVVLEFKPHRVVVTCKLRNSYIIILDEIMFQKLVPHATITTYIANGRAILNNINNIKLFIREYHHELTHTFYLSSSYDWNNVIEPDTDYSVIHDET